MDGDREPETEDQIRFMRRALVLARRGAGRVSPNPMVGAVVVRNGQVVGEGFHLYDRLHHAERLALDQAGEAANAADLYLTLEPCIHSGRTPPCTEGIIRSGVKRVFVAVRDPNPRVSGGGVRALRKAGIQVEEGLLGSTAALLNEKFFRFISSGFPFVLLKLGLSLDGKIATRDGESKWITGPRSRRYVQRLRYEYDAVLVGVETILKDDPSLAVRWVRRNSICKVVLDSYLRTPREARIFDSGDLVVIFHSKGAPEARQLALFDKAILCGVSEESGLLSWSEILSFLGEMQVTSLLIEGGSRVAGSALQCGVVSRIHFFYGPIILGGKEIPSVGGEGSERLDDAQKLENLRLRRLDSDFLIDAQVTGSLRRQESATQGADCRQGFPDRK